MAARGCRSSERAFSSDMTMTALAPSFIGELLPAVTTPLGSMAGLSLARDSMLQSARTQSSQFTVTSFFWATWKGTTCSLNEPFFHAREASM